MKQLYRSRNERVIAGVCGGIAEHFGVDATLLRLVWALFVFFGGTGLLLYVLAWIIIPERPFAHSTPAAPVSEGQPPVPPQPTMSPMAQQPSPPPPADPGRGLRWGGVLLILLGAYLLVDRLIDINLRAWWPVLLIVFGVALLLRSPASGADEMPPTPSESASSTPREESSTETPTDSE